MLVVNEEQFLIMKKHVLFIVQNNSFPFDKRVQKEAYSLSRNGYKVFVISPVSKRDAEKRISIGSIEVYRYKDFISKGTALSYVLEYLNSVFKIFFLSIFISIKEKINVIHVANPPDFFWPLAIFCKVLNINFIYDQHDLSPEMFKIKFGENFLYKLLLLNERFTAKIADSIIVVNNSFKNRLIKLWEINNKECIIIPNGPSKDFTPVENRSLTEKYAGKKIILYVGLMTINDNIEIIIEAANKIVNNFDRKDCFFVLVGDGDVRERMEELTSIYSLNKFIEFAGIVDYEKVKEYLFSANVCIAPDQPNGLNEYLTLIKVLEYMKAKKPFVSFDLMETKNIAGNSGLYAQNLDDYIEKILYLLDNPQSAAVLGEIGGKIIENEFLWEHSEKKLLSLYTNLLEQQ
jgi:glycosyltransferase involved in cell wall biosynthesis